MKKIISISTPLSITLTTAASDSNEQNTKIKNVKTNSAEIEAISISQKEKDIKKQMEYLEQQLKGLHREVIEPIAQSSPSSKEVSQKASKTVENMKEKGSKLYKSVLPNFFNRDKSTESVDSTSSLQPVVPLRFQSTNNNQQEVIDPVARFQQSNNIDQQQFMSYSRMPARMTISTEEYKNLKQRTAFMDDAGKKTGEVFAVFGSFLFWFGMNTWQSFVYLFSRPLDLRGGDFDAGDEGANFVQDHNSKDSPNSNSQSPDERLYDPFASPKTSKFRSKHREYSGEEGESGSRAYRKYERMKELHQKSEHKKSHKHHSK